MAGNDTGKIVLARTGKGVTFAAIAERQGARLAVITEAGVRETWTADKVFFVADARVPLHALRAAADAVTAFRERVGETRESVDLASLWEVVAEDATPYAVADLAGLLFPAAGPEERAATAWALAEDDGWFKACADGEFAPHNREAVEAAQRRRQRERQERDQVARAAERLRGVLDEGEDLDPADPATRLALQWLRTLAVFGAEEKDGERAIALLTAMAEGNAPTDPEGRAFQVLVRLRIFHEDEILAMHRNRIRREFPDEVQGEAEALADAPLPEAEARDRVALSAPPGGVGAIAIDDPWTHDVDDALMVEPGPGGAAVHVLIADPSALIPLESGVGREGMLRAASLYLPVGKIPMIPKVLSEGALSLTAGEPRPMLDFRCEVRDDGTVGGFRIQPVWATLDHRLTYDEVDARLADPADTDPHTAALRTLRGLADALRRKRLEAGAIILERSEVSIRVEDGRIVLRRLHFDSPARQLVQEFMVLACSQAGNFARQNGIPTVYRRQNPPEDKNATAGLKPGTRAFAFKMLRSLRRAELTTQPDFHWGLGVVGYTQVTSPLRRFQDFLAHVQFKGFLRDGRAPLDTDAILRMFGDLEAQAEALTQTEREAKRYYVLKALRARCGEDIEGEVVAAGGSRAIVEFEEFGLDLPVPGLGHLPLGSRVRVRVRDVEPRRDRVTLVPI